MTTSEPSYPPLSTREIQTLPEGARVIVTWAEGNDGPHEYRVHWRRGEPYAQTDEDHRRGRVDLEKWLTSYIGPRPIHASLGTHRSTCRVRSVTTKSKDIARSTRCFERHGIAELLGAC